MTAKDGRQRQGRRSTMALAKTGCVAHLWDQSHPPRGCTAHLWESVKAISSHQPSRISMRSVKRRPHPADAAAGEVDTADGVAWAIFRDDVDAAAAPCCCCCCIGGGEGAAPSRAGAARFMAASSGLTRGRPVDSASSSA